MKRRIKIDNNQEKLIIGKEEFWLTDDHEVEIFAKSIADFKLSDLPRGVRVRLCDKVIGGRDLFCREPHCTFEHRSKRTLIANIESAFILTNGEYPIENVPETGFRKVLDQAHETLDALRTLDILVGSASESIFEDIAYLSFSIRLPDQRFRDAEIYVAGIESRLHTEDYKGVLFLCHASEDKVFIDRLAHELDRHALHAWYDKREIFVGDSITGEINRGLSKARIIIAVLSKNSVKKPWVQRELNSSLMRQISGDDIKILPVLVDKCQIPSLLKDMKYADFTESFTCGFKDLLKGIRQNI